MGIYHSLPERENDITNRRHNLLLVVEFLAVGLNFDSIGRTHRKRHAPPRRGGADSRRRRWFWFRCPARGGCGGGDGSWCGNLELLLPARCWFRRFGNGNILWLGRVIF